MTKKKKNICISLAEVQENEIKEATHKYLNTKLSSEDAVSVYLISKSSDKLLRVEQQIII